MRTRAILAGAALTCVASAQGTWTVGPGAQFSDIQPAIDAASPGDTILVLPGSYSPAASSKGVRLLGGPGVVIHRFPPSPDLLTVDSLPADQTMIVKGFELTIVNQHRTAAVRLTNNLGKVILEDVSMSAVPLSNAGGYGLEVEGCRQVSVNSCTAVGEPAVICSASTLSLASCRLDGQDAFSHPHPLSWHSDHALHATGSRVTIGWSQLDGGSGAVRVFGGLWQASPAARLDNCTTVLTGDASAYCVAGSPPPGGSPVSALVVNGGTLFIDPSVTLASGGGTPPITGSGVVTRARRPALRGAGAPPGGTLDVELYSVTGDLLVLAASMPANWSATPFGDLWLDPRTLSVLAITRMGPSEHSSHPLGVPASPGLRGLAFSLQAVAGRLGGPLRLSNSATVVLH